MSIADDIYEFLHRESPPPTWKDVAKQWALTAAVTAALSFVLFLVFLGAMEFVSGVLEAFS